MSAGQIAGATVATLAGLGAVALEHASSSDGNGDPEIAAGLSGGVTLGFAVLLFVGVLPRAKARASSRRAAETAVVTSLVGFLSVASAWTGLPFVLGAGGAMLGIASRGDAPRSRERGLGGLAVALGVVAVALGILTPAVL